MAVCNAGVHNKPSKTIFPQPEIKVTLDLCLVANTQLWVFACGGVCIWWCMHVVVYACGGVCMWWCIHVMVYVCSGVCMWWCMHVVVYVYGGVCMWWCMHVVVYACRGVCIMCAYMHVRRHSCI